MVHALDRNTGPNDDLRRDAIAVPTPGAVKGKLRIINQFFTGLKQVQRMQFRGPDNKLLHFHQDAGRGLLRVVRHRSNGPWMHRRACCA